MGCLNSKEKNVDSPRKQLEKQDSYENINGNTPPATPVGKKEEKTPKATAAKPAPLAKRLAAMMKEIPRETLKERAVIRQIESQTLHRYVGELNGLDIAVDGLKDSELYLFDITAQVQIDEAEDSTIVVGPCEGYTFIRNCKNCTMYIAASQLRTRDCENCTIYLYCPTEPVIEMSHGMRIGSWNVAYPGLTRLFDEIGFNPNENKCYMIHDFTPNHESLPPVHWHRIPAEEIVEAQKEFTPEKGEPYDGSSPENPVPLPKPEGAAVEEEANLAADAEATKADQEEKELEKANAAAPIDEETIDIQFDE